MTERTATPAYIRARSTVDPVTGCWEWNLKRGPDGYGMCYVIRDVTVMAHRVSYIVSRGSIPEGLTLDHLCRNRACVNPEHLEPVSMRVNTLRAARSAATINAAKTHCVNGHPFDEVNTRQTNRRACRACNREAVARYKERRAVKGSVA